MWIFETDAPIPGDDLKLVVPNGHIKLVIPFLNGLNGKMEGCDYTSPENSITLIGLADIPSRVDTVYFNGNGSGTIGVEFTPIGAYRLFKLNLLHVSNKIYSFSDLFGPEAREFQERITDAATASEKTEVLQRFLIRQLLLADDDPVFDYCIQRIMDQQGLIKIGQLEKETGYSSRWLNEKFKIRLGISPKNLCSIIRFQRYYQASISQKEDAFFRNYFYQFYYDQSHFIKDYKRFTGLSPKELEKTKNEFGKIFYKD